MSMGHVFWSSTTIDHTDRSSAGLLESEGTLAWFRPWTVASASALVHQRGLDLVVTDDCDAWGRRGSRPITAIRRVMREMADSGYFGQCTIGGSGDYTAGEPPPWALATLQKHVRAGAFIGRSRTAAPRGVRLRYLS